MEFEKNRETWQGTYRQTDSSENSLAMQWLGLSTFTTMARFPSLVRELGSYKLHIGEKEKKDSKTRKCNPECLRDSSPTAHFPQGKRYVVMSQT